MAYYMEELVEVVKTVVSRDGNANVIRCQQEWRKRYPNVAGPVPQTVRWEEAFRLAGLVPANAKAETRLWGAEG